MDLQALGIVPPSGHTTADLRRDLEAGKRILLRGTPSQQQVRVVSASDRTLRFIASTDGIKRDGNRVRNDPGSWDFANFAKNPVMLWAHDYGSSLRPPLPPIGSWEQYGVEQIDGRNALVMTGRFATHDFADLIYRLYLPRSEGGDECLYSVSIGWAPLEWQEMRAEDGSFLGWDFLRNELLECSPVPIPADPDATKVAGGPIAAAIQRGVIPPDKVELFVNTTLGRGAYVIDLRDRPSESRDVATEPATGAEPTEAAQAAAQSTNVDTAAESPSGDTPEAAAAQAGEQRSELSDAVDPAYDRLRATYSALYEPVEALWYALNAVIAADNGEGTWMLDPKEAVARNLNRIRAMASDLLAHADAVAGAAQVAAEPDGVETASATATEQRKSMKLSGKRLEKLYSCRNCFEDGIKHLREVIQEGEDERTPKDDEEKQDEEMAAAEVELAREYAALAERLEDAVAAREYVALAKRLEQAVALRRRRARKGSYAEALLTR